jgi:hypothetical protein
LGLWDTNDDDDDTPGRVAGDSISLDDVVEELRKRLKEQYGVGGAVLGDQVSVVPLGAPDAGAGGGAATTVPSFFLAQFTLCARRDVV